MRMWLAKVNITLKEGILDPQGKAVEGGLRALGYQGVQRVRVGKLIEVTLEDGALSREAAERKVKEMCERLLANPVIEEYKFELVERGDHA